ncbi:MAG: PKD domain-containing protein [Bacteroidetes bacterium]|nr:PKD domain-containing protein [Bacteroidota bacterium]
MMRISKIFLVTLFMLLYFQKGKAQIDTSFWFAAPWVTPDHWWKDDIKFHFAGQPGTIIRFRQPAYSGPSKYDTTFVLDYTGTFDYLLWRNKLASPTTLGFDYWENRPVNSVVPYGIYISSSPNPTIAPGLANPNITVVYDVITRSPNFLNPETFSLKGQNGIGKEFYCPFQTNWYNVTLGGDLNGDGVSTQPRQQIVIVATQPNTTIWITPKTNVVGHLAGITYSVFLTNAGEVYNVQNIVPNTNVPGNNLSGSVVVADKNVCVTVADDSVHGLTGCYDLMGDQIVPVDVIGTDYVLNKGFMNSGEPDGAYIVGTQNFTKITVNDGTVTTAMINKGDTYYYHTTQSLTYINASKPIYCLHASGIGCELGEAILPPLTCAGSSLVAFSKTNNQRMFLNILCKNGAQNSFTLTNSTGTLSIPVPAASFSVAPGTATLPGGPYMGTQIDLTGQPIQTYTIANSYTTSSFSDANNFALGVFGGNSTTGGLFHYMSSFKRRTFINAPATISVCAVPGSTVLLTSTVTGGAISGMYSTSAGTSSNIPTYPSAYTNTFTNVIAVYTLSPQDILLNTIDFTVTSIGECLPTTQTLSLVVNKPPQVTITSSIAPICKNNVSGLSLTGAVINASTAVWSGGSGGIFGAPGPNTTYTPSPTDLSNGIITFTLTSQIPNLGCINTSQSFTVGFIDPPTINGVDATACTNQSVVTFSAAASGSTLQPNWSSNIGTGIFLPTNQTLTPTYQLSTGDYTNSVIPFTVTLPGVGGCAPVSSTINLNIIAKPSISVSPNFTVCASAGAVALNGTVTGAATTGSWTTSDGTGVFTQLPPSSASYTMSQNDTLAGNVTFVLISTPGQCPSTTDTLHVSVLKAPVVSVNSNNAAVCENAPIQLVNNINGYTTSGIWSSTGTGAFTPSNTIASSSNQVLYYPSPGDVSNGSVILTLSTLSNQGCPAKSASFTAIFVQAPKAQFNISPVKCLNAPVNFINNSLANGTSSLSYQWYFGDSPSSVSSATNPIYTYTNTGTYVVTMTVTGTNSLNVTCPDTVSRNITVYPLPVVNFTYNNACQSMGAQFFDLSTVPSASNVPNSNVVAWNWQFGVVNGTATVRNPVFTYTVPGTYNVMLTAITNNSCSASITKLVTINSQPKAQFGMTNNPAVANEPIYFSDFSLPTGQIQTWSWNFGDNTNDFVGNTPSHAYANAGNYIITLTVKDLNGCVDSVSKNIEITLLPQVPTGFTPNGDKNNDLLFVKGGPFENMKFQVYNNWGELVFETTDQKIGWDGTKDGVAQPVGVYVWVLQVDMYNNRSVKKNGDVTLLR